MTEYNECQAARLPRDLKTVRAKKREIGNHYKQNGKKNRRRGWWRTRIGALNKVFGGPSRYGDGKLYQFADDDAGREDLQILLDHYASSNPAAVPRVIKARAPWLSESERESLIGSCPPRYWDSPSLADTLGLTEAERSALGGVPTIGAVDVTPNERKALRLQRNKQRRQKKRLAAGVKPQSESVSRAKPWLAETVSRAKWYRNRRETTLDAVNLLNTASKPVSTSEPSHAVPMTGQREMIVSFRTKPAKSPPGRKAAVPTLTEHKEAA